MADRAPPKAYSGVPAKYSSGGAVAPNAKQPSPPQNGLVCPALHLYPLNDTFVPKQINLAPPSAQNRIKIGRYSNAKSVPNPINGYFDSKVLSRAHAEVWSENDKVYIKDVKSSNGTFVNGNRLSPESQESEPYELNTDDVVDFGIDILTDDNKEILHHRVACRVFLVMTPEDALKLRNDFTSLYRGGVHGGTLGNAGICPGAEGGLRRGKPGVNFDHVIFRLQNELQKSKMVGTELTSLTSTIRNIHETLGGGAIPVQNAPYPHLVPPQDLPTGVPVEAHEPRNVDAAAFASLESQLGNTHAMLASHVERIKGLESTLAAYEHVTDEVANLKQQLEDTKRDLNTSSSSNEKTNAWLAYGLPSRVRQVDDDDGASVASVETTTPSKPQPASEARIAPDIAHAESERSGGIDSGAAASEAQKAAIEHSALLARIESLERELRERDARDPNRPVQLLNERVARVEHELLAKEATQTDTAIHEQEQWRRTIEHRWDEQSQRWAREQEKIKTLLDAWSNPSTPRMSTSSPDDTSPPRKDAVRRDPKSRPVEQHSMDSVTWLLLIGVGVALSCSATALLRSN